MRNSSVLFKHFGKYLLLFFSLHDCIFKLVEVCRIRIVLIAGISPANICWSSRRLEDVLKTSLEEVFKASWRKTKCLLGISVSNKSKSKSDELRRIQDALVITQQ